MRDLDRRDLVKGDFLVVAGDVVSNINLEPVLARHRARREKDKNAIMTMVLGEQPALKSRLVTSRRRPTFVLDPAEERCLHYEVLGTKGGERYLTLDPEFLEKHAELEIREDLTDYNIDICTPEVLALWTDNFDYQSLRTSFLFGVLKDYELNGKTIHTHITHDQYAARIANLRAYHQISKDILAKRIIPFCPDSNILEGQTYRRTANEVYHEVSVRIERSARTSGRCILGDGTIIGEKCAIISSSIGRRCNVGKECLIQDAQIWNDVTIADGVKIVGPVVIGHEVNIAENASIKPGAVIAAQASIGPGEVSSNSETRQADGPQRKVSFSELSDASSDASVRLDYKLPSATSSQSSISTFASSDEFEPLSDTSRRSSVVSERSDDITAANKAFLTEATASVLDGLSRDQDPNTVFLELNGLRLTEDASQHQVRHAVAAAYVKRVAQLCQGGSARDAVKTVLEKYKLLFERIITDKEEDERLDQVDLLLHVQKEVISQVNGGQLLLFIAKELYETDVVEEDGVLQWWNNPKSQGGEMGQVRELTEQFIKWLEEAAEDEESDEEEDSE